MPHRYTAEALSERGLPRVEASLRSALAQLEEHQVLLRKLEERARESGDQALAAQNAARADQSQRLALQLRQLLSDPKLRPTADRDEARKSA